METITNIHQADDRTWEKIVLKYAHPNLLRSIWQIINSVVPFLFAWFLVYKSLSYPYWVTILLSLLASGFLIRIFIIFHDCGHDSFFRSRRANYIVGIIMGIITFTPYYVWHHQHAVHHSAAANLDKRGVGDVWTMTVSEYQNSSKWSRLSYRVFRNPFIMFTFGPVLVILIKNRVSLNRMTRQEKINIYITNVIILLMAAGLSLIIGIKAFLLVQLPILLISHSIGIWLFYIQHQFDDVTWERQNKWNYKSAAFKGCSFLKLPSVLQWFTGNIGFHHVHHLSSRIPNYKLEKCHYENEVFKDVKPIVLLSTFKALFLSLWDETSHQLISFRSLKTAIN